MKYLFTIAVLAETEQTAPHSSASVLYLGDPVCISVSTQTIPNDVSVDISVLQTNWSRETERKPFIYIQIHFTITAVVLTASLQRAQTTRSEFSDV